MYKEQHNTQPQKTLRAIVCRQQTCRMQCYQQQTNLPNYPHEPACIDIYSTLTTLDAVLVVFSKQPVHQRWGDHDHQRLKQDYAKQAAAADAAGPLQCAD